MKELELTLKLRNNRLKRRRLELKLSARALTDQLGMHYALYLGYESMRRSPLGKNGDWRPTALRIAEFYGESPEELWPDAVLQVSCPEQRMEVNADELRALAAIKQLADESATDPERLLMEREGAEAMRQLVEALPQDQQDAIEGRFEDDRTLLDIGTEHGIGRESIRQREERALKTLRRPANARILRATHPEVAPDYDPEAEVGEVNFSLHHGRIVHLDDIAVLLSDNAPGEHWRRMALMRFLTRAPPSVTDYNVGLQRTRCISHCLECHPHFARLAKQLDEIGGRRSTKLRRREAARIIGLFERAWGSHFILRPLPTDHSA